MCKKPASHMGLFCNSCGKNVFKKPGDYFMLKDEVWAEGDVCPNLWFDNERGALIYAYQKGQYSEQKALDLQARFWLY